MSRWQMGANTCSKVVIWPMNIWKWPIDTNGQKAPPGNPSIFSKLVWSPPFIYLTDNGLPVVYPWLLVLLHSLHEEVGDPQAEEQIPGALLLLAVVLAKLNEVIDIRMPRLQIPQLECWNRQWQTGFLWSPQDSRKRSYLEELSNTDSLSIHYTWQQYNIYNNMW